MRIDLIIENADIVTMDAARPSATRVGILNGRVVGCDEELDAVTADVVHDAEGSTVVPGFIDAHTHLQFTGQGLSALDIGSARDIPEVLAQIAAYSATVPADGWVEIVGYDQRVLGRHLNAAELDAASGGLKVWARHISSHAAVVSSAVLAAFPDQSVLDDENVRAGVLIESDQELVRALRVPYSVADIAGFIERAGNQARSEGITFCMEAGNGGFLSLSPIDLASYLLLLEEGRLPVRIQAMPTTDVIHEVTSNAADVAKRGLDLGIRTGFGGAMLGFGAQKIMLDGGMMVRAAHMTTPYVGTDNCGGWQDDPDRMRQAIIDGHDAGWQMAIHAIGDRAMDFALEAVAAAQSGNPRPGIRHRIEHGGAIRPDQIAEIARLNIAVVTQPAFLYNSADDFAKILGPEREPWLYRGRSLLDGGVRLVGSTDRPLPGSPLRAIQSFVDRTHRTGQVIGDGEQVSVQEALELFTIHGAWIAGRENDLGRIRRGFFADFAVLERNPLRVPVGEIGDIRVRGSFVNGEGVWV